MMRSAHAPTLFAFFISLASLTFCAAIHDDLHFLERSEHIPADQLDVQKWLQKDGKSPPVLTVLTIRIGKKERLKHESFTGVADFIRGGHNITKLSHMLYRVIKEYKIKSMVDVPCRAHSRWMGQFLENVESPEPGKQFRYFCVDSNKRILDLAASRMPDVMDVSVNYIDRKFWKEGIPTADLVFCWEGLEKMRVDNVKRFLQMLGKGLRHEYLLVGTSPTVKKNKGDLSMNVKRAPFSYGMPMRIFKQLAVDTKNDDDVVEKQMYLYSIRDMQRDR